MKDWFFREDSYKKILARLIEESPSSRGMVSRIADAIGCQRSYLSQVLHSKVQLTKDQAWNLCRFFGFSREEADYFQVLVDHERAVSPAYRAHLKETMGAIRAEAGKVSKQFSETKVFSEANAVQYFASWLPSAVHVLSSIPELQDPAKMAARLHVSLAQVSKVLSFLQSQGMVEQKKGKWSFKGDTLYVPPDSPFVSLHHQNWRQAAVAHSRSQDTGGLHFTMVQSMSQEDFEKIKAMILELISREKKIAGPSEPEVLTALTLDFFQPLKG